MKIYKRKRGDLMKRLSKVFITALIAVFALGGVAQACIYIPVAGCMDNTAGNYNPSAVVDDGSCFYPGSVEGVHSEVAGPGFDAPGVCTDNSIGVTTNAEVLQGTPGDGTVTINWALVPNANQVHIIYREEGRGWEHALRNAPNDGHATIGGLKKGVKYFFIIAGVQDCGVGPWSSEYSGKP